MRGPWGPARGVEAGRTLELDIPGAQSPVGPSRDRVKRAELVQSTAFAPDGAHVTPGARELREAARKMTTYVDHRRSRGPGPSRRRCRA